MIANTSRLNPSCVFGPDSAEAVSGALQLFELNECKFAIRSGGHMASRGASNIDDGILLATTRLNQLSLHPGYVSVGSGLRWGAVFEFLEPHGLAVVGGRVAEVGVAGLTLGGGLSSFSGKRGFVCDNVKNFQVNTKQSGIMTRTRLMLFRSWLLEARFSRPTNTRMLRCFGPSKEGLVTLVS